MILMGTRPGRSMRSGIFVLTSWVGFLSFSLKGCLNRQQLCVEHRFRWECFAGYTQHKRSPQPCILPRNAYFLMLWAKSSRLCEAQCWKKAQKETRLKCPVPIGTFASTPTWTEFENPLPVTLCQQLTICQRIAWKILFYLYDTEILPRYYPSYLFSSLLLLSLFHTPTFSTRFSVYCLTEAKRTTI